MHPRAFVLLLMLLLRLLHLTTLLQGLTTSLVLTKLLQETAAVVSTCWSCVWLVVVAVEVAIALSTAVAVDSRRWLSLFACCLLVLSFKDLCHLIEQVVQELMSILQGQNTTRILADRSLSAGTLVQVHHWHVVPV